MLHAALLVVMAVGTAAAAMVDTVLTVNATLLDFHFNHL